MDKVRETLNLRSRGQWQTPTVTSLGTLGQVLQCGTAKTSPKQGDPGESFKNTVHEG
jgi:hypothetical protein